MKCQKITVFVATLLIGLASSAQQNDENYFTFNDRRNVVHGVYLGLTFGYGEIEGEDAYTASVKIAYVANRQFEVGFFAKGLYSDQDVFRIDSNRIEDLVAGYLGLHLEPIFFSKSRINLSFPLQIGGGGVSYTVTTAGTEEIDIEDDVDPIFVLEPGVSALFNVSRFVQLEAGAKYRFSSEIELADSPVERINGFSGFIGVKLGIFNMGRNRYKKQLD